MLPVSIAASAAPAMRVFFMGGIPSIPSWGRKPLRTRLAGGRSWSEAAPMTAVLARYCRTDLPCARQKCRKVYRIAHPVHAGASLFAAAQHRTAWRMARLLIGAAPAFDEQHHRAPGRPHHIGRRDG